MRIVLFCHSIVSDWNHGNAHFLRGLATELLARGHDVRVYEPVNAWSVTQLLHDAGPAAIEGFHRAYPGLSSNRYDPGRLDLDEALEAADLVLVHEWNEHPLVARIGRHRAAGGRYALFFHDTHHRSVSDEPAMGAYDLEHYDAVLAFGEVIRQRYVARGWARRAFTWHEAADVRVFTPRGVHANGDALPAPASPDLLWVGNWGDEERSAEIREFLVEPVKHLGLRARVHGVRYPGAALEELRAAGIDFAGWLPNFAVPEAFGHARATVHIPRRPYVETLPGVPTIRMFEALACGIPLVSCRWDDVEGLFEAGRDYVQVRTPGEMRRALRDTLADPGAARARAAAGLRTIHAKHTCRHRVDELLGIRDSVVQVTSVEAVRA